MLKAKRNSLSKIARGFTLAEVLVTLAVIGVVAALTIPAIVSSSQESETVSQVLKYQSVLSQAFDQYALDKDCVGNLACTGAFVGEDHQAAWDEIKPYFNVIKDCGTTPGQGCYPAGVIYKHLNGDDIGVYDDGGGAKAILADGSSVTLTDQPNNCEIQLSRNGSGPLHLSGCGTFVVDVNGHKGPNQRGRDVFTWWITKGGIYPIGALDDKWHGDTEGNPECDPTKGLDEGGAGPGCTAKVIKEKAINY